MISPLLLCGMGCTSCENAEKANVAFIKIVKLFFKSPKQNGTFVFCSEGDVFCALESGAFAAEEKQK